MKVYTVTLFAQDFDTQRTVGWFHDLCSAEALLKNNQSTLSEYLYQFAVIECFPEGYLAVSTYEKWYELRGTSWETGRWVRIKKPKNIQDIVDFAIN